MKNKYLVNNEFILCNMNKQHVIDINSNAFNLWLHKIPFEVVLEKFISGINVFNVILPN